MKTLETNRLLLRDWCESDIGCEVFNEDIIRYLISTKNNYAIVKKDNNKVIGTIGLNEDADGNINARNVGVRIIEQYRNKGFISEALKIVIENAHYITNTLSWFCRNDDVRSQHIAKKFGFKYIKTFSRDKSNLTADYYYYTLKLNSNKI